MLPPIVRVAKAYQRLLSPMIAGSEEYVVNIRLHTVAICYNIPGKLAPPILGPLGARCLTVGCETTCCARPSKAAQTKAGVCMLM
jgi:hypothetical protein